MIVVADSSPLIILAKLGYFKLLHTIYTRVYISPEVHHEVVITGAGLPGAAEVSQTHWVEVRPLQDPVELVAAQKKFSLGIGELGTILLGKELHADAVLLDDSQARKLARTEKLEVRGSMGLLETLYLKGQVADLRVAFQQLLLHAYIDRGLLNDRLRSLDLPPL